ncbi:hypothetical protein HY212_01980 [Candidatus Pacearchaeota archaeon]|nr:hypothetical protein [Candidatus Pacearchaeota archaeon]
MENKNLKKKHGQEELIGFGIIVVIVLIILLVFLSVYLRKPSQDQSQSYKVESFINSVLEYTSSCEDVRTGFLPIRELLFECYDNSTCVDGKNSCAILGTTIGNITKESWVVTNESQYKAYSFNISGNGRNLVSLEKGIKTPNSRGYKGSFSKKGVSVEIVFTAYY